MVYLALIYGSVARRTDTSASDIDLLIVADGLTLEAVYAALSPAEDLLDRKVNPTLYSSEEFIDVALGAIHSLSGCWTGR